MVAIAAVPSVVILFLLILTFVVGFTTSPVDSTITFSNYADLYTDRLAYTALINTIGFTLVTIVIALGFGVPLAWLVERTDMRARSFVHTAANIGLLVPAFFKAMGWLYLLHPNIGILNQALMSAFGLESAPISILNIFGMGWVQGLSLTPLVFIMVSANLRAMNPSLEESAEMSGANFLQRMRRITLPLAFPAILGAALFVIPIGFSAFDIPLIIGLSNRVLTFSTYVYIQLNPTQGLPNYGTPAAFGTITIALGILMSWWYTGTLRKAQKFQLVTGKHYRPKPTELGRWKGFAWFFVIAWFLLVFGIPMVCLLWASLLPYLQPPSAAAFESMSLKNFETLPWGTVMRGLTSTLILAVAAPTITLIFSVVFSWLVLRQKGRFSIAFDYIAFLPHVVPSMVFAFGALIAALFVIRGPIDLYATLGLILIVYVVHMIPFGTRMTNAALVQIHTELEEAAFTSGASTWQTIYRIILPLLKPALVSGWLFMALLCFRELTIATILFSPANITLPVVIWSLFSAGNIGQASAASIIMVSVLILPVLIYMRLGNSEKA